MEKPPTSRNKVTEAKNVEDFQESLQIEGISSKSAKIISHLRRSRSRTRSNKHLLHTNIFLKILENIIYLYY